MNIAMHRPHSASLAGRIVFLACLCILIRANDWLMAADFDVVILHGRVVDPESRLDAVRNVGIRNGKIEALTSQTIKGRTTIDGKGLVVAPGFIDLHQHGQIPENYRAQVMDGVTSSFELEAGAPDINAWYAEREGKAAVNYGASIGHIRVRMKVMNDPGDFLPSGAAIHKVASNDELKQIRQQLEVGVEAGCRRSGLQHGLHSRGHSVGDIGSISHRRQIQGFRSRAPPVGTRQIVGIDSTKCWVPPL